MQHALTGFEKFKSRNGLKDPQNSIKLQQYKCIGVLYSECPC